MINKPTKGQIGWAILVIAGLVASLFFGVKYPLPPGPDESMVVSRDGRINVRTEKALAVDNWITDNGTLAVTGATTVGGTLGVTGATTMDANLAANGGITVDSSNFTVNGATGAVSTASSLATIGDVSIAADTTGGNLGAKNELIGLPKIKLVGGAQGTNPGSQTISLVDDSPDGEYAAVDASVVLTADTSYYKYGSKSLKAVWAADAAAADGFLDAALGANASWEDMESVGLLVYSTATWAAGDLTLVLVDNGGAQTFNIPALTDVNKWTWLEVDISALNGGTGDVISDVKVLMSAQGAAALGAFTSYLDIAYVWDSADEEALGQPILQDGVLSVINTETGATLAELTDYIVHYENGNDFIVYITDQSTADIAVLVAVQQIG